MKRKLEKIVSILKEKGQTVSTMESCTGGAIVNAITNISGASRVLEYSAVTYCNEFKVKMGVSKEVIDKYSVYSMETAREMALAISKFTSSDFGIGITGKLGKKDINNEFGDDNQVFVSIYDRNLDKYICFDIFVDRDDRRDDKLEVLEVIIDKFLSYLEDCDE